MVNKFLYSLEIPFKLQCSSCFLPEIFSSNLLLINMGMISDQLYLNDYSKYFHKDFGLDDPRTE